MAEINGVLAPMNFEIIRDQIAAILALEIANQLTLNEQLPPETKDQDLINTLRRLRIITERYAEPSPEDYPFVDVFFFSGDFDNKDPESKRNTVMYFIDLYFTGEQQTPNGPEGGSVSARRAQRVAGIINSILEHPAYNRLKQPNGIVNRTLVRSIKRTEEENSRDVQNIMMYRVIFEVVMGETVGTIEGVLAQNNITTVKIGETDLGYVWEFIQSE